jgi:uncharacterized membrane protein
MPYSRNKKISIIALIILGAYMAPFLIMGENIPTLVHDNLDANLVWTKVLAESGKLFGSFNTTIPQIMGGLPRNTFGSEFQGVVWLFSLFPPFPAYALNLALIHFVAFVGMYLLLSRHVIGNEKDRDFIIVGGALAFALLPFWPFGGLSVAGMPLALYTFLNIRNRSFHITDWIILGLIPIYASFPLSFVFFLSVIGLIWFVDLLIKRDTNPVFFFSIFFMTGIFLLIENRLIYDMFLNPNYTTHRVEFAGNNPSSAQSFVEIINSLNTVKQDFIFGQHISPSLQQIGIGLSVLIALILVTARSFGKDLTQSCLNSALIIGGIGVVLVSFVFPRALVLLWGSLLLLCSYLTMRIVLKILQKDPLHTIYDNVKKIYNTAQIDPFLILLGLIWIALVIAVIFGFFDILHLPEVKGFHYDRYYFLHPLLWYLIFALSLSMIGRKLPDGKWVIVFLLILQIGFLFTFSGTDFGADRQYQVGGIGVLRSQDMSFAQYYSEDLFQGIKEEIGKPQEVYRIVSIGIAPSITLYNGFYTVDGFMGNYPLEYKHEFRQIIAPELAKNEKMRQYFDDWGSKCYIFSSEVFPDDAITKDEHKVIKNLDINTMKLKEMGGRYVLSAVEIENYQKINLTFIKTFENSKSPWKIWLYEVQ